MLQANCTGCSACAAVCPTGAITMQRAADGFLYPVKEESLCTDCGLCEEVCPVSKAPAQTDNSFFALRNKNKTQRMESTSGGAFRLLAEQHLKNGGVVFGAAFDETFHVVQTKACDASSLQALLGTKYVQSDAADSFQMVKELLQQGTPVLYCASPCMVHGLLTYLADMRQGLTAVDHICYGTPSPGFWDAYVAYLEAENAGKLEQFTFRDKRKPDSAHSISYRIDGKETAGALNDNRWCRIFFKNLSLRSSCFHCHYCSPSRYSDLTLGDFWGIENCHPELDDGYGVSLVITHTPVGKQCLQQILPQCDWAEVTQEQAMQPRLQECAKEPMLRRFFLQDLQRAGGAEHCDMAMMLKKYGV